MTFFIRSWRKTQQLLGINFPILQSREGAGSAQALLTPCIDVHANLESDGCSLEEFPNRVSPRG